MLARKSLLFLYPTNLKNLSENSAPFIRPKMLIESFSSIGLKPILIDGNPQSIYEKIVKIEWEEIAFAYGENLTIPLFLSEGKKKIATNYFFWEKIFKVLKKHNIPTGFFIRDIYWRFPSLLKRNYSFLQIRALLPLYMLEYQLYYRYANVLFVPSLKMSEFLPGNKIFRKRFVELPPGTKPEFINAHYTTGNLDLVYFGGIVGSYEMPLVFSLLKTNLEGVKWHFFVRKREWNELEKRYGKFPSSVKVYHIERNKLRKVLENLSPILVYFPSPICKYNSFNRNLKIMDAISWGIPIIIPKGVGYSKLVEEKDIGWVIKYDSDTLKNLIIFLRKKPEEIINKKINIEKCAYEETWEKRAQIIAESLMKKLV